MVYFLRSLHVRTGVVVKSDFKPVLSTALYDFSNGLFRGHPFFFAPGKPVGLLRASGYARAIRRDFVGQNQKASAGLADQSCRLLHLSEAAVMLGAVAQWDGNKSRAQGEASSVQLAAQLMGIHREETVGSKLGPR